MKYIKTFENAQDFKVGNYVKFADDVINSYSTKKDKYRGIYRIITISSPMGKSIALRPISNHSDELIYMSGDFINVNKQQLILVPDYEIQANKYNI